MFLWAAERCLVSESQPHWHLLLLGYVLQGGLAHPIVPPASPPLSSPSYTCEMLKMSLGMRNATKGGMEGGRPLMAHCVWALDIWASFSLPRKWGDSPTKLGGEHPIPQGPADRDGPEGLWGPLNPGTEAYRTSRWRLEASSRWVEEKGIPSSPECPPKAFSFPFGKDERNIIHLLCRTSLTIPLYSPSWKQWAEVGGPASKWWGALTSCSHSRAVTVSTAPDVVPSVWSLDLGKGNNPILVNSFRL